MDYESTPVSQEKTTESIVGQRLKNIRTRQGYSLRALSDRSGLNVNTLSLIENGKSSPSVGTLQQLAMALKVSISDFFEDEPLQKRVVFTPANQRPQTDFGSTRIQNLGQDLTARFIQPLVVTLKPGVGSGEKVIVHTGYEFVYVLEGSIEYKIENDLFSLNADDSLAFEAHLQHSWVNTGEKETKVLLILVASDENENAGGKHFRPEYLIKEMNMKIAVITEDGKSISRHFGRAPYFLVLNIEEGKIADREMRAKLGHNQFGNEPHTGEHHGEGHGHDHGSHLKHSSMAESIKDCKVVICGGMGMGAYESMRLLNIQPIVTEENEIEAAVQAFIDGKLIDHTELLH